MNRLFFIVCTIAVLWFAAASGSTQSGERQLRVLTGIAIAGNPYATPVESGVASVSLNANLARPADVSPTTIVPSHLAGEFGARIQLAGRASTLRRQVLQRAGVFTDDRAPEQRFAANEADENAVGADGGLVEVAASSDETGPADADLSETEIATALQTYLRDAGCYHGQIDGIWGRRSRSAFQNAFAGRDAPRWTNDLTPELMQLVAGDSATACARQPNRSTPRDRGTVSIATSGATERESRRARTYRRTLATTEAAQRRRSVRVLQVNRSSLGGNRQVVRTAAAPSNGSTRSKWMRKAFRAGIN